jgi:hypothetical protein
MANQLHLTMDIEPIIGDNPYFRGTPDLTTIFPRAIILIVKPYPEQTFTSKKSLKDAIILAQLDVTFIMSHNPVVRKKLSQMKPGEVLTFQGPGAYNPKWFGRLACTAPVKGLWSFDVQ